MPKVGGKRYSYDKSGREAAARARKLQKSAGMVSTSKKRDMKYKSKKRA